MKQFLLITLLLCTSFGTLLAQRTPVTLSEKHVSWINKSRDGAQKLRRYNKVVAREKQKEGRLQKKSIDAEADSIDDAIAAKQKALEEKARAARDGVNSKIYRTVYAPWASRQAALDLEWLEENSLVSPDLEPFLKDFLFNHYLAATQDEVLLSGLRVRKPNLKFPKKLAAKADRFDLLEKYKLPVAQPPPIVDELAGKAGEVSQTVKQYAGELERYKAHAARAQSWSDSLGYLTAQRAEQAATEYLSKNVDGMGQLDLGRQQLSSLKSLHGNLSDTTWVKEQAKKKAQDAAMDFIESNPAALQAMQKKMAVLMKKYSYVPNSNDLSTAIKRTSLQGRTFGERIVFAANFQPTSLDPLTLDLSPMAGYRFNTRFIGGIGANYRQTFADTIPTLAPSVLGYKAFSSYDILRDFFAYGEFTRNSTGIVKINDQTVRIWRNAAFAGIGRRFAIHKKLDMTVTALYNFLYENPDPVYPRRWIFRVGFQSSELAFFRGGKER